MRSGPLCFASRGFFLHAAQIVLSPEELLEKLAALVPPPRLNLVRYHGVLAPNAAARAQIVPGARPADEETDAVASAGMQRRDDDGGVRVLLGVCEMTEFIT